MLKININMKNYRAVRRVIYKLDLKRNSKARGAFKRSIGYAAKRSWVEAIPKSNIKTRTGELKKVRTRSEGNYVTVIEPIAKHAAFFWYGTRRSRGRWIKYIRVYNRHSGRYEKVYLGKRFRKDRISMYIRLYGEKFVGWHPGISIRKFPLRRTFNTLLKKYVREYATRWFERHVGGV